jgi:hypothetical protein
VFIFKVFHGNNSTGGLNKWNEHATRFEHFAAAAVFDAELYMRI